MVLVDMEIGSAVEVMVKEMMTILVLEAWGETNMAKLVSINFSLKFAVNTCTCT